MATDEVRGAVDRLKEWADTIQHYGWRTVVGGTWVGHEEFRADLALVESALTTERLERAATLIDAARDYRALWRIVYENDPRPPTSEDRVGIGYRRGALFAAILALDPELIPAAERATAEPHAPWCPHVNVATELCACKTRQGTGEEVTT